MRATAADQPAAWVGGVPVPESEVDAYLDRLGTVRRHLHDQLARAIAHREETCLRTRTRAD
jgi:hypothetical protein